MDELLNYAAPIYIEERDEAQLRELYNLAVKTKRDLNIAAIAKQLYDYSKIVKDDAAKKKMLMLILDTCDQNELKSWYETCKDELGTAEWEKEYAGILEKVKKKDVKFYLDICMETGKEDIVLKYLQDQRSGYDFWDIDYDQYFSRRLASKYPDEVLELYWRDVNALLNVSKNKNYEIAVRMLSKIKSIMKKNKRKDEWEKQFAELKEKHKRKKNFIALLD